MPESPETCTCGTVLADKARFCHRCGRPVGGLTVDEPEDVPVAAVVAPPIAVAPPQPPPVGFGNPIALRVAFLMSLGISLAEMLPVLNWFFFVWWLVGGWGGVRLYRRLTGLRLSVGTGARLGFLTGVFSFVSMTVVISLSMASTAGRDTLDQMVKQMKQDPRLLEIVNNPTMLGAAMLAALLIGLVVFFASVTGLCAAGGALGAKYAASERKS